MTTMPKKETVDPEVVPGTEQARIKPCPNPVCKFQTPTIRRSSRLELVCPHCLLTLCAPLGSRKWLIDVWNSFPRELEFTSEVPTVTGDYLIRQWIAGPDCWGTPMFFPVGAGALESGILPSNNVQWAGPLHTTEQKQAVAATAAKKSVTITDDMDKEHRDKIVASVTEKIQSGHDHISLADAAKLLSVIRSQQMDVGALTMTNSMLCESHAEAQSLAHLRGELYKAHWLHNLACRAIIRHKAVVADINAGWREDNPRHRKLLRAARQERSTTYKALLAAKKALKDAFMTAWDKD